jgi:MFS family permease
MATAAPPLPGPIPQNGPRIGFKAWWTVAIVGLFNIVSLIDRTIVAVLIPEMRVDLGLNDFQISLVQGMAFALFYGAVGLVIGGLVDRYSKRHIMFAGILLWSAAAAATGLARNYVQLFFGRLLVGFGEGAISPAAQSLLSSIFPRHRLSTPMAVFTGSGVIGTSLSFLLGGLLLAAFTATPLGGPLEGLAPWRQVLIVTGAPGILIALLAFTMLEPRRPPARAAVAQGAGWGDFFLFLRSHKRMIGGMMLGYGLSAMGTQGMMTWAPTYARRVLGMGAAEVGGFMSLAVAVGGVVGGLGLGLLVDRLFRRGRRDIAIRVNAAMLVFVTPFTAIAFLADNATLMFGSVLLTMLTVGACFGPALAAVQMVSPVAMRGRCAALAVLVSNLGGYALGPMLVGAFTDYVYRDPSQVGLSIATVSLVLGPLGALALWWARAPFLARLEATRDQG